jgi:hypothetical protein
LIIPSKEKVDINSKQSFQRPGPVQGEPEDLQDPSHVAKLGEELDDKLAVDGGHSRVVVGDVEHHPGCRKLHGGRSDGLENPRRMKRDRVKIRGFIPGTVKLRLGDLLLSLRRFLVTSVAFLTV